MLQGISSTERRLTWIQRDCRVSSRRETERRHPRTGIATPELVRRHIRCTVGQDCGTATMKELETLAQQESPKTQTVGGKAMEDVTINPFPVNVLFEEQADYEEYLRVVAVVGKGSSIGHHAAIEAACPGARHGAVTSELMDEPENEFAGAGSLGTADECVDVFGFRI